MKVTCLLLFVRHCSGRFSLFVSFFGMVLGHLSVLWCLGRLFETLEFFKFRVVNKEGVFEV